MKNRVRLMHLGRGICLCIKREVFYAGSTRLRVEDLINIFMPWRSTRIMTISGTNAFYSEISLCPFLHRLLCYNYCADALNLRDHGFYRHALVLGCGGGAIPKWLLEEYKSISVDVVDYSEEVIEVSKKYFLNRWKNSGRLKYYCTDAQDFNQPEYQYDFIFCDLFDGVDLVPFVYSKDFAKKLRGMISDDGILVINCGWGEPLNDIIEIYQNEFKYLSIAERESWQTQVVMAGNSAL